MLIHRTNELTTFFSTINQEELRVKIDTGSKYNVISQAALNHVNPNALIPHQTDCLWCLSDPTYWLHHIGTELWKACVSGCGPQREVTVGSVRQHPWVW